MDPDYAWIIDEERRIDDATEKWTGPALTGLAVILVAVMAIVWMI
ncbi:hypothetical protein [Mycobacterium sp.]|nr:hypothetical protein [Mycobacterium sp.]